MPKRSKESKNGSDLPHLFGYAVEIDQHLVEREESYERFGPWSESYSTDFNKSPARIPVLQDGEVAGMSII